MHTTISKSFVKLRDKQFGSYSRIGLTVNLCPKETKTDLCGFSQFSLTELVAHYFTSLLRTKILSKTQRRGGQMSIHASLHTMLLQLDITSNAGTHEFLAM